MNDEEKGDREIVKWLVIGFSAIEVALICFGYKSEAITLLVCLLFFFFI